VQQYGDVGLGLLLGLAEDDLLVETSVTTDSSSKATSSRKVNPHGSAGSKSTSSSKLPASILGKRTHSTTPEELSVNSNDTNQSNRLNSHFRLGAIEANRLDRQVINRICKFWTILWTNAEVIEIFQDFRSSYEDLALVAIRKVTIFLNWLIGRFERKDHIAYLLNDNGTYLQIFLCKYVLNEFHHKAFQFAEQDLCHIEASAE
jgi:hypothetical protein